MHLSPNVTELIFAHDRNQGVSVADITKLKSAGIATVESVISVTRANLGKIKGFSEAKVEKIK